MYSAHHNSAVGAPRRRDLKAQIYMGNENTAGYVTSCHLTLRSFCGRREDEDE